MRVEGDSKKISWGRIIAIVLLLLVSIASGYVLQPEISGNKDAISTIVTIFSILAGFLIAVITFVGDPSRKDWRELQLGKPEVEARLRRHRLLFYLYLITLGLAVSLLVLPGDFDADLKTWIEGAFVACSTLVFLVSFTLPNSLSVLQMQKYEDKLRELRPPVYSGEQAQKSPAVDEPTRQSK